MNDVHSPTFTSWHFISKKYFCKKKNRGMVMLLCLLDRKLGFLSLSVPAFISPPPFFLSSWWSRPLTSAQQKYCSGRGCAKGTYYNDAHSFWAHKQVHKLVLIYLPRVAKNRTQRKGFSFFAPSWTSHCPMIASFSTAIFLPPFAAVMNQMSRDRNRPANFAAISDSSSKFDWPHSHDF